MLMIAKVLSKVDGRITMAFEAETPAEGMILGLVAVEQPDQRTTLQTISTGYGSLEKPPETTVTIGACSLHTVQMIQGR